MRTIIRRTPAISLVLVLALSLFAATACIGGTSGALGRTYQGPILQLTLVDILRAPEIFYGEPEPSKAIHFDRNGAASADGSLAGTSWTMTSYGEEDSPTDAAPGSEVTIEFAENGAVRGNSGCNTYSGLYSGHFGGESPRSVDVTGLTWTERACEQPDGVMDQESAYLDLLGMVGPFRIIEGDRLTLWTAPPDKIYRIQPSAPDNELVLVHARVGNHAATKVQLEIEALPAELRMDVGRYYALNTYEVGQPYDGFLQGDQEKDLYVPFIRGSQELLKDFQLDGWMVFEAPKGSKANSIKWEAGGDIIIIDL